MGEFSTVCTALIVAVVKEIVPPAGTVKLLKPIAESKVIVPVPASVKLCVPVIASNVMLPAVTVALFVKIESPDTKRLLAVTLLAKLIVPAVSVTLTPETGPFKFKKVNVAALERKIELLIVRLCVPEIGPLKLTPSAVIVVVAEGNKVGSFTVMVPEGTADPMLPAKVVVPFKISAY